MWGEQELQGTDAKTCGVVKGVFNERAREIGGRGLLPTRTLCLRGTRRATQSTDGPHSRAQEPRARGGAGRTEAPFRTCHPFLSAEGPVSRILYEINAVYLL